MGAGTYAYVVAPAPGTDAIKVAMLYKPGVVTPAGPALNYQASRPDLRRSAVRPPAAGPDLQPERQRRDVLGGGQPLQVEGQLPGLAGDPDAEYGQGCWNAKRVAQANALLGFIATLQATDPDVLVIGDLNAYGAEDPINTLVAGGLINEVAARVPAATRYTYIFDGLSGYLDQGLATHSLDLQVSGVTLWHNNADEPSVIDYDLDFKPPSPDLYTPTPYRASDHDPVVIGINLMPAIERAIAGYVFLDTNGDGWRQNERTGRPGRHRGSRLSKGGSPIEATQSVGTSGWYAFSDDGAGQLLPGHRRAGRIRGDQPDPCVLREDRWQARHHQFRHATAARSRPSATSSGRT